jgi:site-specific DNA-methyltransferase (adenine-specific)
LGYKDLVKESYYNEKGGILFKGDCLTWMAKFPNKSVDMILCDLPYGTTQCKWDSVIPLDLLWEQYERIIKDRGNIVLFGSQPFTTELIHSNLKLFKYCWVWDKVRGVGHLNAKKRPMMATEDVCVFYKNIGTYNPQMREREKPRKSKNNATQEVYGKTQDNFEGETLEKKYPINLITFNKSSHDDMLLHPTQKPLALIEYLVKTYSNENEIILDNTAGSCTTAVACKNTNRKWICIEKEEEYCVKSVDRIISYKTQ